MRTAISVLVLVSCGGDVTGKAERAPTTPTIQPASATEPRMSNADLLANAKYLDVVENDDGTCVLYADGRVACWRSSDIGQPMTPTLVRDISEAIAIQEYYQYIEIVLRNGKVWQHKLRFGPPDGWDYAPDRVAKVVDKCVLLVDGNVRCACSSWIEPPVALKAVDLAYDDNVYCAVTAAGDVECWGQPSWILGDHPDESSSTDHEAICPTARGSFRFGDAVAVAVGIFHACALKRDGKVVCWGVDEAVGGPTARTPGTPVTVPIPPARSIRSWGSGTCAITRDLHAYCWGSFQHPAFADGIWSPHREPAKLPLDGVVAVSPRAKCAIVDRGNRVTCWGPGTATYDIALPP